MLDQRKQFIEKATVELNDNIIKDTTEKEKVLTLEERRKQEKVDVRNDMMSENLAKIVKHTADALKKRNTYIVNPADQPGVTTSIGNMIKSGSR